jgi:hypothetical protein
METKVIAGQSLFDIAIQDCGTIEAIFGLSTKNGLSITEALNPGQTVERSEMLQLEIYDYYRVRGLHPATGSIVLPGGIGYMGIQIDFIVS